VQLVNLVSPSTSTKAEVHLVVDRGERVLARCGEKLERGHLTLQRQLPYECEIGGEEDGIGEMVQAVDRKRHRFDVVNVVLNVKALLPPVEVVRKSRDEFKAHFVSQSAIEDEQDDSDEACPVLKVLLRHARLVQCHEGVDDRHCEPLVDVVVGVVLLIDGAWESAKEGGESAARLRGVDEVGGIWGLSRGERVY
jgi:hypothetical protein